MPSFSSWPLLLVAFAGLFSSVARADDDILETNGFNSCMNNSDITVQRMHLSFDRTTNIVNYNLAGTSNRVQNVKASIDISAYGHDIKNMSFDPCSPNKVDQLCPVPKGTFAAQGQWTIPAQYAAMIPAIAYSIPNLEGESKIELTSTDGPNAGQNIACYQTAVSNTKTFAVPAVSWIAAGIAGAALVVGGLGALSAAGAGAAAGTGVASPSPTFGEVIFYFQGIAQSGMLSVDYPSAYRSFTQNFAFSTGLVGIQPFEVAIDNFRASTGGNLTGDSVQSLQNTTLVYTHQGQAQNSKRSLEGAGAFFHNALLAIRDNSMTTSINGSSTTMGDGSAPAQNSTEPPTKQQKFVSGIEGYANALAVPNGNTFMTALLIFAIILAAVIAGILLFKVILEAWSLFGNFPKKLTSFRKNYWWLIAKTVTNLILLLYGVWVLYCVYQFRLADSWAAKALAAVTLLIFTAVLVFFAVRIFMIAHKFKKLEGNSEGLYKHKDTWRKYSIFYDNFKKGYWWMFVPAIIFMFAKGVVLAGASGDSSNHSLAQTAALLIVDSLMFLLLLVVRPYEMASGNWINIVVQAIRVISCVCILVFVEQLGFSQTTKTVTGVALIVVQASMTAVLGILITINAIVNCVRMNPHRKARKEAEKMRDADNLTPLDAHNSLLMYPSEKGSHDSIVSEMSQHARGRSLNGYDMLPLRDESRDGLLSNASMHGRDASMTRQPLLPSLDGYSDRRRSGSPEGPRRPQLPDLDRGFGQRNGPGLAL